MPQEPPPPVSINTLLKSLRPTEITPPTNITADEIAFAVSNIFSNQLSPVQTALLLYTLSLTGLEHRPDVLAKCANAMRAAAEPVDIAGLKKAVEEKGIWMGGYQGGLVWYAPQQLLPLFPRHILPKSRMRSTIADATMKPKSAT